MVVGLHEEAGSGEQSFGCYLYRLADGALSTHTHACTVDAKFLRQDTANLFDGRVSSPTEYVIGSDKRTVLVHFMT